jgi:hypothetical protein
VHLDPVDVASARRVVLVRFEVEGKSVQNVARESERRGGQAREVWTCWIGVDLQRCIRWRSTSWREQ